MHADESICITCGAQYATIGAHPTTCPICEDDRQYVNPSGQQWTSLGEMRDSGVYRNIISDIEPGLIGIRTDPAFAIAQRAHLIRTNGGNVLWDCISYVDEATVAEVERRGGIAAIAISHPHFYTSMVEWSRAFGDVPIYLHADNRPWVMRPDPVIHYWSEETVEPLPGLTLIRCGGHFPGSTVIHWAAGAEGGGALLTGDTIYVVADPRWVTFMYSYPNAIPLNAAAVRGIVDAVEPFDFARLYSSWPDKVVDRDAKAAVRRSAGRYIAHIGG